MTEIYNTATTLLDVSPSPSSAEPRRSSFHNKRPSGWHRGHCQSGGMWGDSVEKITDLVKRGLAEASRRSKQLSDFIPRTILLLGFIFHRLWSGRAYLTTNEKHTNTRVLGAADAAAPSGTKLVKRAGDK